MKKLLLFLFTLIPFLTHGQNYPYATVATGGIGTFMVCGNEGLNYLVWDIDTLSNVHYFTVEFSRDGQSFQPIYYKDFNGQQSYRYDHLAIKGWNHYRLKTSYNDGVFTYSDVISKKSYIDLFENTLVMEDVRLYNLAGERVDLDEFLPTNIYLIEYKGIIYKLFKL